MYTPSQFAESRTEVLHDFIQNNPFGTLIVNTSSGLDANHLPFEVDATSGSKSVLRCHVARANPIWRNVTPESEVLVVFQGPHAYISPGWYPSKQEAGKAVPTWNYIAVHAYGSIKVIEDSEWLLGLVSRLSDRHEASRAAPWRITDAPADFTAQMLRAIVGIEIEVSRLAGKWKLGQNRSAADVAGVVDGLSAQNDSGAAELARLTRRLLNPV